MALAPTASPVSHFTNSGDSSGRNNQPRLQVEQALAIEQGLHAGALPVRRHATDNRTGEHGRLGIRWHTHRHDGRRRLVKDHLARLGQSRVSTERGHRFALAGQQSGHIGRCQTQPRGKGIDKADDRGRRQRDNTGAGLDQRHGNAVKEVGKTHGFLHRNEKTAL